MKAAVIVCALAATSCLVPQSVDPIAESPHPPPHFVLESIPPYLLTPELGLVVQGSADVSCHCALELSVPFVEEDDPTITLEARWFVDYDPNVASTERPWGTPQVLEGSFDTTETQRPLNPFVFDAKTLGFTQNGSHVVEVVVGESTGFDPASTTLPNRAMKPGYTAALYRFFVNVTQQQGSTCLPPALPSVRVCQ